MYDFLLVHNSNVDAILYCFGDIAYFIFYRVTPHLFNSSLGVFPLHQMAHIAIRSSKGLKLFGLEIIFEVLQPVWKTYLNVTDKQMDNVRLLYNCALRSIVR